MVYTRSKATRNAALLQSTASSRAESPIENHISEQESSDEDDEGIPNKRAASTPRPRHSGVVPLRLPFQVRPPKRPLDDGFAPRGKLKRQKINEKTPVLAGGRHRLTSTSTFSSQTSPRVEDGNEDSNKGVSPGAENEVSDELVKCVSSILSPSKVPMQQQTSEESPGEQLLQEELLRATDHSNVEREVKAGPEEHVRGLAEVEKSRSEGDNPSEQDDALVPDYEPIAAGEDLNVVPDSTVSLNSKARLSPAPQRPPSLQKDLYEIPISPPPTIHLDEPSGLLAATLQPWDGLSTKGRFEEIPSSPLAPVSHPFPENIPSQMNGISADGDTQNQDTIYTVEKAPCVEANPAVQSEEGPNDTRKIALAVEDAASLHGGIADEPKSANEGRENDEFLRTSDSQDRLSDYYENIESPIIDCTDGGYSTNGSDVDLSVEESFYRDAEIFRNRLVPEGEVLSEVFEDPHEDDLIGVHIESNVFKEAMKLMRFKGWSGLRSGWTIQALDTAVAQTQPGRCIMPLLAKLKRLYLATPRAPHLRDQNIFLAEHSDMITYYFSKIRVVIIHIRRERLERPEHSHSAINRSEEKRKQMAGEIMSLIIPMILQVLTSAWKLGGDQEDNTQFTASTVELLRRGIGWVVELYYRALREFSNEGETWAWNEKNNWRAEQQKRAELGVLLDKLVDQIKHAPDMLLEKEREKMEKEQILKMQKEKELQWERNKQEEQRRIREQNSRAFRSIEGKSVPSIPSPSPLRRTASTHHQLTLSAQQWSQEEKDFLFRQLRQSYPNLPDLAGYVRQELNRDLNDIKGMSRDILRAMLKVAYDQVAVKKSATDVEAEIENMFRGSVIAW